jgi:1-acyl-sn-glycerol-3-phosphate acyltransferase
LSYAVTNLTVTLFWILFFVLNRTTVIGRQHLGYGPNTLLLSNHQSMIDSFLVGLSAYYPRSLVCPRLLPWNPAAAENFYKTPLLAWLADKWRCIPVREGRRDLKALRDMIRALPTGVMVVFPEGSRSRDGSVRSGRAGVGMLILATRPRTTPVAIHGMHDVLPIGRSLPRIGKRIHVTYGPPLEYEEFLEEPTGRDAAQALADKAMDRIRSMHAELTGVSSAPPE